MRRNLAIIALAFAVCAGGAVIRGSYMAGGRIAFAEGSEQFGGVAPLDIPPRLGELERRLTLAHLVAAWPAAA